MRLPSRVPRPHPSALARIAIFVALGIAALAAVRAASAQAAASPPLPNEAAAPGVSGRVIDAATGEPIGDAFVLLMPLPEGVLPGGADGAPASIAQGRRVRTDAAGLYRFQRLAAGSYRLHVSRIGYAAASVDVTVQSTSPDVGVGLVVAPVTLTAVRVTAAKPDDARRSLAGVRDTSADARLAAERARQAAYVSTDVRALTEADVAEAVTPAETDLLRGLQRAPGVSTRDEWSAELWTRGGRSDQTRILYDGLPLFTPFHLYGGLSGVMPEAVGAAFLHPGVRPASLGEGSAGVLDLQSAPGNAGHSLGGRGEVSIFSARAAVDGAAGPLTWNVGGRRSYLDAIVGAIVEPGDFSGTVSRTGSLPGFGDAFARVDYSLGGGRTLTASGIAVDDFDHGGNQYGFDGYGDARWGNRAARLTFAAPLGALRASQTVGGSAYRFRHRDAAVCPYQACGGNTPADPDPRSIRSGIEFFVLRGELAPAADSGAPAPWSAGYELNAQRAHYTGPPGYYSGNGLYRGFEYESDDPLVMAADTAIDGRLSTAALWATRRWAAAPRVSFETGLRLEGAAIGGRGTRILPAPRLAVRLDASASTRFSAAVGRSVQYTQALQRVGIEDPARFYPNSLWLTSSAALPPLTTDLFTLGAERWLGHDWLAAANGYWRRAGGVATMDPTPGTTIDRPLFVVGRGTARGVDLSLRRLAGRTTASVSYSYGVSTIDAAGFHYFAPQDRTHAVDVTLARHFGRSWRLAMGFSGATGAPFTSTEYATVAAPGGFTPVADQTYTFGEPGADRRPPAFLLGTEAEWTHHFSHWQLGTFAQVQSPLAHVSSGSYRGVDGCSRIPPGYRACSPETRERTFNVFPTVGLRFAF